LGDEVVASMPYLWKTYDIYCLQPEQDHASGRTIAEAIIQAYGGTGIDATRLCSANPMRVQLDQAGYVHIASQQSVSQMMLFVERVLNHVGASVKVGFHTAFESFAEGYSGNLGSDAFADMVGNLRNEPYWTEFDPAALCVTNREVDPSTIQFGIDWVCSQEGSKCEDIPTLCSDNPYRVGDFLFSRFAREASASSSWNPLLDCDFGGAALFAPSRVYETWSGVRTCAADGTSTTALTKLTSTTETRIQDSFHKPKRKIETGTSTARDVEATTSQTTLASTTAETGTSTTIGMKTVTVLTSLSSTTTETGTSTTGRVEIRTNPYKDAIPVTEAPPVSVPFLGPDDNAWPQDAESVCAVVKPWPSVVFFWILVVQAQHF